MASLSQTHPVQHDVSPTPDAHEQLRREWRQNWQVAVVAAIAIFVSMMPMYSLGPLMPSIHASTGWTRSQISSGLTITSLGVVLLSPFVGSLVDRYGSRRIAIPGLICFCLGMALLSLTGNGISSWWMLWGLVAITDAFIRVTVWTTAVVTRFERGRGLAIGVALSGTGIGSTCLPYLTTVLQETYGWRATLAILPLGGLVLALPLIWLYFYGANDGGKGLPARRVDRSNLPGMKRMDAVLSRRYLQMFFACLLAGIGTGGLAVHFVPILRSEGLVPHTAAAIAAGIGISVIVGRLSSGYLLDRVSPPMIGVVSCLLPVLGCPVLLFHPTAGAGLFAAVMLGLASGSEIAVLSYLVPRYFGVRHFGFLFGMISGLQTLGTGVGPWLAGSLFDRFGNYNRVLLYCLPLFLVSALLFGTLEGPASRVRAFAEETA